MVKGGLCDGLGLRVALSRRQDRFCQSGSGEIAEARNCRLDSEKYARMLKMIVKDVIIDRQSSDLAT